MKRPSRRLRQGLSLDKDVFDLRVSLLDLFGEVADDGGDNGNSGFSSHASHDIK